MSESSLIDVEINFKKFSPRSKQKKSRLTAQCLVRISIPLPWRLKNSSAPFGKLLSYPNMSSTKNKRLKATPSAGDFIFSIVPLLYACMSLTPYVSGLTVVRNRTFRVKSPIVFLEHSDFCWK